MNPIDNPIYHKALGGGDALEIEVIQGGLNLYNYDAAKDDSYLTILGAIETRELVAWLNMHIKLGNV